MLTLRHVTAATLLSLASALAMNGCATDHSDIPASAMLGTEGTGRLNYTAPYDGTVYVYDSTTDHLIYSGRVLKGQSVSLDPSEDRLLIDGRTAYEGRLPGGDERRIYFDRERDRVFHNERYD